MSIADYKEWPSDTDSSKFSIYKPRAMCFIDHWLVDDWAIKTYAIQSQANVSSANMIATDLIDAAEKHLEAMLPLTDEEGAFYKTGFAVLHQGKMANWLLFQWWTHDDVWCQILSYSKSAEPLKFMTSSRRLRACVYETAIIWYEQQSWIRHVLNGTPNRLAYLQDVMTDGYC